MTDWNSLHGDHFRNARVLVTGGAGFIGSHLAQVLATPRAQALAPAPLPGRPPSNLHFADHLPSGGGSVTFVQASILDRAALERVTTGCRYVFHQGALPSVPRSIEHPVLYEQVNVTGTLYVLEAARAAGVRRVMFAASSSAYGDSPTLPKIETMPVLPKSPYAANKLAGEHLMRAYANCYNLDAVSLRYFNIFGPRQNANSAYAGVIAAFAKCLAQGQPPRVDGDGQQSRDFTFVDNAVHANLLAARRNDPLKGEVVNVGCGARVTVLELAQQMAQQWGGPLLEPTFGPDRAGDVKHSLADLSRTRQLLKYEPIVDFTTGLAQTVQWYRTQFAKS